MSKPPTSAETGSVTMPSTMPRIMAGPSSFLMEDMAMGSTKLMVQPRVEATIKPENRPRAGVAAICLAME